MTELIHPEHLLTMSPEDIEAFLTSLRDRRERIKATLKKVQTRRTSLGKQELGIRLEAHCIKLAKAIDLVDTSITKAELIYAKIVALRIQHGDLDLSNINEENALYRLRRTERPTRHVTHDESRILRAALMASSKLIHKD